MHILRKAASRAAVAIGCLALCACATTMPAPERPGQLGQVERGGKRVNGIMVEVHAPAADHCTYNGAEAFRTRDGGYHDFLFTPGAYSAPEEVRIDCRTAEGYMRDRTLKAPFNDPAFRINRTATTVGAIIGGGPLGLISGPLAAEMARKTFFQPPILIHLPDEDELATDEARENAREAAVGRWADLRTMLDKECDADTRTDKTVAMGYACERGFFAILRDVDLAIFAPSEEAEEAVSEVIAEDSDQPSDVASSETEAVEEPVTEEADAESEAEVIDAVSEPDAEEAASTQATVS